MSTSQNRRLSGQINIGLDAEQTAAVEAAARQAGISRAAFVRQIVVQSLGISNSIRSHRIADPRQMALAQR